MPQNLDHRSAFHALQWRWSHLWARIICPRKHLRVLPSRTRPSLYADD